MEKDLALEPYEISNSSENRNCQAVIFTEVVIKSDLSLLSTNSENKQKLCVQNVKYDSYDHSSL